MKTKIDHSYSYDINDESGQLPPAATQLYEIMTALREGDTVCIGSNDYFAHNFFIETSLITKEPYYISYIYSEHYSTTKQIYGSYSIEKTISHTVPFIRQYLKTNDYYQIFLDSPRSPQQREEQLTEGELIAFAWRRS